MRQLLILIALPALLLVALLGCASKPAGMPVGTVQLRLTDAPGTIDAAHLVITEVSVHRSGGGGDDGDEFDNDTTDAGHHDDGEFDDDSTDVDDHDDGDVDNDTTDVEHGGWEVVKNETFTVDLMTLRNGVFTTLGVALVPAGHYTQIRLKLGPGSDVVVDGVAHPLVVPSGMQSGLKLIHPFTVPPEGFVDLLLDINAQSSITDNGNGTWMLHPTAKVTVSSGTGRSAQAAPRAARRTL